MNREILFRGKSINSNKWIEGSLIIEHTNLKANYRIFETSASFLTSTGIYTGESVCIESISQFTGLTDNKGTYIFENDIISVNGKIKKVVKYNSQSASFQVANVEDLKNAEWQSIWQSPHEGWWNDFKGDINVVGNIFDTPELLEVAN